MLASDLLQHPLPGCNGWRLMQDCGSRRFYMQALALFLGLAASVTLLEARHDMMIPLKPQENIPLLLGASSLRPRGFFSNLRRVFCLLADIFHRLVPFGNKCRCLLPNNLC